MKKSFLIFLAILMALTSVAFAQEGMTIIPGKLKPSVPVKKSYPDNPVQKGVSPTTGLPFDGPYTPILVVIDNAKEAHPHWGVGQADLMYQVPNAGVGATKLLALFSDQMPELAGGSRSARAPFVDIATTWQSAFVFAGTPGKEMGNRVNVPGLLHQFKMKRDTYAFDLLGVRSWSIRSQYARAPHNLSIAVKELRDLLVSQGIKFSPRPMRFTDTPLETGPRATFLKVKHFGDTPGRSNSSSEATFTYDPAKKAYHRATASGPYVDLLQPETPIPFANVIVVRVKFGWQDGYVYLRDLVGSGSAEIFMNGHYMQGGWYRQNKGSRLVFLDSQGEELALQRGKTFVIVTNDVTEVAYR